VKRMLGQSDRDRLSGDKEPPIVIAWPPARLPYGKNRNCAANESTGSPRLDYRQRRSDTTNPQDMIDGGAQLPLGSKRNGRPQRLRLASMVDILCCVLSGANWGPFAPPFALRQEIPERSVRQRHRPFLRRPCNRRLIDKGRVKKQIDDWIHVFRKTNPPPAPTAR